jgi:hypothetical protein
VTQKAIDDVIAEMKNNPPVEMMQKLLAKFKELNAVLSGQSSQIDQLDIQKSSMALGAPVSAQVAATAQDVMKFLMEVKNVSKAGAAAIAGNLNNESSFRTDLIGDHGTAHGVAQWRGNRWNELQMYAVKNGMDVNDRSTQLQFLLEEMHRNNPDLYARIMAGTEDPAVLAKAMMDQYERPNKDPAINHVADRMSNARSFFASSPDLTTAAANDNVQAKDKVLATNAQNAADELAASTMKNLTARLNTLGTQARISTDSKSIQDIQKQIEQTYSEMMDSELKKFDADHIDNASDPGVKAERQAKIDEIKQKLNANLLKVMEEYGKAADEELDKPVKVAQAKLDAMQAPDMANKYTQLDIQKQQQAVVDAQRAADAQRVLLIEQQIAEVKARAAAAPEGSDERTMWINQENDLVQRSNELKTKNLALDQARNQQAPTVAQGIQSATQAWAQQNGILDQLGQSIPLSKQMENSWGQVLDGLSSGFSQFFMDIASGTMSAGEAFKKLGLSVVQMFMQIIAKALANQIIMSLFGGGTGGGSFLSGLFGVVGKATGGTEPPGMATGGRSSAPFRDGILRKLMPGEYTLRQSAVNMIGREKLDHFNNLGNRQISEGGLGHGRLQAAANSNQPKQPDVNVWVVSPDEKPQLGPNDVVHIVADNIVRRGALKTLIHTTAKGS